MKKMKLLSLFSAVLLTSLVIFAPLALPVQAAAAQPEKVPTIALNEVETVVDETVSSGLSDTAAKAITAGALIAIVAGGGAFAMAISIRRAMDNIGRQPEAASSIRTALMLGLVFIETAIIYALIVAILIVFVL